MSERVIGCEAVKRLIGMPDLRCCNSCHVDEDEGYYSWMCSYDFGKDRYADICCTVYEEFCNWLDHRAEAKDR